LSRKYRLRIRINQGSGHQGSQGVEIGIFMGRDDLFHFNPLKAVAEAVRKLDPCRFVSAIASII
jgi:hypothetical protein